MSMTAHAIGFENIVTTADCDLVARAVAGREDCFEELVRRYQRPIAAYVYRLTGNYDAALDLTQDVFIKVYNSLARYRSEYKFSTWIYKIAHNTAVDYLRRPDTRFQSGTARGSEVDESDIKPREMRVACRALTPEQSSEKAERRATIEHVVRQLPEVYRELIVLRHSHDLNYDEIAEVTGLPLGTVKNRIFRAREIMRRQFLQKGITGV
ncbi:MAG: sigma-70 family RNA polymerase sigma factor [Pyrinomonadaceae bacterium]